MSWSTHQQALLREMGIRLWMPPDAQAEPFVAAAEVVVAPPAPVLARPADIRPVPAPSPAAVAQRLPASSLQPARPVVRPETPVTMPPPTSIVAVPMLSGLLMRPPGDTPGRPASPVEQMNWEELAATVSSCRACGLCENRRQTVFGVGHHQARWMLIGEAPGEQEDREGEPFVGKAGQLLDNMLRAAKLTRGEAEPQQQVYIANVLKCRPPQNRNPLPEEVARCEPFLRRQVALVQPDLILAMGRFAVQSLLGSQEPIGRLRGRVHDYLGVPVVVTYHPAYLLRNPLDKSRSWEDLCLAHEVWRRRSETAG